MVFEPLKKEKKFFGNILVEQGIITKTQLEKGLEKQKETGGHIGDVLVKLGYISEEIFMRNYAVYNGYTYLKLSDMQFHDELRKVVPLEMARKFKIMPVAKNNDVLTVAMSDPDDVVVIDEIKSSTKLKVTAVFSSEKDIEGSIERLYGGLAGLSDLADTDVEEVISEDEGALQLDDGEYDAEDAPIVKFVNSLIHEAVVKNASDVHLEPLEIGVSLRLRVDGKLQDFPGPAKRSYSAIVSRIKIMAQLDITERRLPQDGKCRVKVAGAKVDIRVSTLPTIYGEKVVMRILQRASVSINLEDLGFEEYDKKKYTEALESPHGMILVTGPTGSGKTTTLYAGLNYINKPEHNILTIEDPVEYELNRINQVQVRPVIGLTFATILRRILRQDPDVIMVGEIRDHETGVIAVQAALTGHLVLSTLHTNDAVGTLSRLKFMGIEPFLIADAVELVMAQRLVRKICANCRIEQEVPPNILEKLELDKKDVDKFFQGRGCVHCNRTGYQGRTAIYEICKVSKAIKKQIMIEANDLDIKAKAVEEGMMTLRDGALEKLKQGITTIEEVLTVTFGR